MGERSSGKSLPNRADKATLRAREEILKSMSSSSKRPFVRISPLLKRSCPIGTISPGSKTKARNISLSSKINSHGCIVVMFLDVEKMSW